MYKAVKRRVKWLTQQLGTDGSQGGREPGREVDPESTQEAARRMADEEIDPIFREEVLPPPPNPQVLGVGDEPLPWGHERWCSKCRAWTVHIPVPHLRHDRLLFPYQCTVCGNVH